MHLLPGNLNVSVEIIETLKIEQEIEYIDDKIYFQFLNLSEVMAFTAIG